VVVDGNLRLEGCSALSTLPTDLHVSGSLFLNGTLVQLAQLLDNRGSLARVHGPKDEAWTPVGQLLRALGPAVDAFATRCAGRLRSFAAGLLLPPAFLADVAVLAFGLEPFVDTAHRDVWLPHLQGPGFSGAWPEHLPELRPAALEMVGCAAAPAIPAHRGGSEPAASESEWGGAEGPFEVPCPGSGRLVLHVLRSVKTCTMVL
jgi:hypothetical protein